jgi:hypothetical protein
MSARIPQLLDLFSKERVVVEERESQVEFHGKYTAASLSEPVSQQLLDLLSQFPQRDSVSILIVIGDGEGTVITAGAVEDVAAQVEELHQRKLIANQGDKFSISLTISKTTKQGTASVYSPSLFLIHLNSCSLGERLGVFNDFLSETGYVQLLCDGPISRVGSQTVFLDVEHRDSVPKKIDRLSLIAKRNEVAYFSEGAAYSLIPDDFKLIEAGNDTQWQRFFESMTNLLVVAFTADYSSLSGHNELSFRVNGYKTISCVVRDQQLIGIKWQEAFAIYQWTYEGGSISDKVGLLRNVLSLHLDEQGCPTYGKDVHGSVLSGFAIYLKRNVAQYIEIKNKLAEFLQETSQDALKDVRDYIGAVKQALGAVMTFFVTTMVLRAVSGKGLSGIFTTDITVLTWAFLGASSIYLCLSLFMLSRDMRTLGNNYARIKTQYLDILDSGDLKRIFQDDQPLRDIGHEVKRRALVITLAWIAVVAILAGVAYALWRDEEPPIPQQTIESPAKR